MFVRVKIVNMVDGNCVGCDSITKYVYLKCDKFACNRGTAQKMKKSLTENFIFCAVKFEMHNYST